MNFYLLWIILNLFLRICTYILYVCLQIIYVYLGGHNLTGFYTNLKLDLEAIVSYLMCVLGYKVVAEDFSFISRSPIPEQSYTNSIIYNTVRPMTLE